MPTRADAPAGLEPELQARLDALCEEGAERFDRFDREVRSDDFHPFVASDYRVVLSALAAHRRPGLKFLEWGSAMGVITIMADILGFDACGIELDEALVRQARELALAHGSAARFSAGSFLPTGYRWGRRGEDDRLGTLGEGESGYLMLGTPLDDFDVVFGYPWDGEEPIMLDLMREYGRPDALLLIHSTTGVTTWRGGRTVV